MVQPVLGLGPRVLAKAPGALAGVAAQVGGAVGQIVGPVPHAARDVVEPMAQGLRVEPAARIDPLTQPLIARRA
ncbi:hypothetical protein D3C71_1930260 [compost metagenome]